MVKGVSRRVVVVRPDTQDIFEQAIFLIRDYNVSHNDVVREACRVAERYLFTDTGRRQRRKRLLLSFAWFLAGATVASGIWLLLFL